jgi:hypothetical protein
VALNGLRQVLAVIEKTWIDVHADDADVGSHIGRL